MKKIIVLGIVIFVLAAGYTIAWLWAAGQATDYVKTLETADGVTMPRVTCGSFGIGGFPFGFDATCSNATVVVGDVTITVSGLKASAEVYQPTHVLLFAQSPVSFDDAFTGSRSRLDFASVEASARLEGWRIARVSVVMEAPVWNDTVLDDRLLAKADHLELHLVDIPEQHDAVKSVATLAQFAKIDNLSAPGFQIAAGNATFNAEITNLPDDIRTYAGTDLLRRWQAVDGKFILTSVKGNDGENYFDASGTLALDKFGRAGGRLKLHSRGVVERLGPIIPQQVKGLIVGPKAADGSYSQTLNIAGGVVFSGIIWAGVIPPLF